MRTHLAHWGLKRKICKRSSTLPLQELMLRMGLGREDRTEVKIEQQTDLPDHKSRALMIENMLCCMLKVLVFSLLDFWPHSCGREEKRVAWQIVMWDNWVNPLRIYTFKRRINVIKAQWGTLVTGYWYTGSVSFGSSETDEQNAKSQSEELQRKQDDLKKL